MIFSPDNKDGPVLIQMLSPKKKKKPNKQTNKKPILTRSLEN